MIRKHYVQIGRGQIHYRATEGTGAPIIFLHQTASSSAMFEALIERMPAGQRCIAFDTPGFGNSFELKAGDTIEDLAAWLMEAVEALGIDRFHCVGHHAGACIGLIWSHAAPQRLLSLALCGPIIVDEEQRQAYRGSFSGTLAPDDAGLYLQNTWDYVGRLGADVDLDLRHRELIANQRAYEARGIIFGTIWDPDYAAMLAAVDCPLLLFCSTDDAVFSCHEQARKIRPDAIALLVSGANYQTDLDAAGCAAALRAFLDQIGAKSAFSKSGGSRNEQSLR